MSSSADRAATVAAPPPAVTLGRAMLWNWWVVVLSALLCALIGAGIGLLRTPEYTATARLAVGRIDISSPGALSGFAVATEALATGYSRTVTARAVAKKVADKTGISIEDVQSHVSATPIPKSPVFRVEASSPDEAQALALANLSSHALVRYAAKLNQDDPDSARLYRQYRAATDDLSRARLHSEEIEAAAEAQPSHAVEKEAAAAQSEVEVAALRADALGKAYTTSVQSQASTELIQILSPATEATSDKRSYLLILSFIGLVVGLLLGATAAFLRESRWEPNPHKAGVAAAHDA